MRNDKRCGISRVRTAAVTGAALLATGAALFGTADKAGATPATLGFYPATDIYSRGVFHLDVDTYGRATKTDALVSTGLTYGIGPDRDGVFGRSEIGADYILSLGGSTPNISGSKRLLFNAKTQLYNNEARGTRLVAGFWGVGNEDIFAPNVGYILGSKAFDWGRVHVGLAQSFADEDIVATGDGDDDQTYLHLGYDRYISKRLQFAVDFYSGQSAISGVQPTLYYYVNDKANFGLGWMRFNDKNISPSRNQIYACFDYNFGGSADAAPATTAPAAEDNKGAEPGPAAGPAAGTAAP